MYAKIQSIYGFSDYQIAQLRFTFRTFISEISKLIILAFVFRNNLPLFVWAAVILRLTRASTGGIHCNSYISCLLFSYVFLALSINVLPSIYLNIILELYILSLCMAISFFIGPVISTKHLALTDKTRLKLKFKLSLTIFLYMIFLFIMPENPYSITGFWVIVLNTLQHIFSKLQKGASNEKENL